MREPQQQTSETNGEATLVVGGEETTLVAPRFDDEETLVARPVVPLEEGAAEAAPELPAVAPTARPARGYRGPFAPRRSWTLALVLVSVLIGGVLGGAGLYLYQRQSQDPAVSPDAMTRPAAPADATQAPAPQAEERQAAPNAEPPAEPPTTSAAATAPAEEAPAAAPARAPESLPAAAERRPAPSDGTPKRGKKGDRDEEIERRDTSRPGGNIARAVEPEARQVDTIFYRQRRAERQAERRAARRARREDDVNRLRRIFEGTP
ncbi:MAG TPA: hypothetical protein VF586_19580 [Pyrinomonadaceae bacterium]